MLITLRDGSRDIFLQLSAEPRISDENSVRSLNTRTEFGDVPDGLDIWKSYERTSIARVGIVAMSLRLAARRLGSPGTTTNE